MKRFVLFVLAIIMVAGLVACGNKEVEKNSETEVETNAESNVENSVVEVVDVPKNEQEGTAGSNIPLKDNYSEAEYQIGVAMQYLLEATYGSDVFDARIYVDKIYTAEEEEADETLKAYNLGADEVAFEVHYELKPAEGVDPNQFTAGTGEYDEETGWVKEKYNVGILRPNDDGSEQKYKITDFGTAF